MTKRTKKRVVTAPPMEEVGTLLKQFAEANSRIKELEAREELQIMDIRSQYEEECRKLLEQKQNAMEKLEAFGIHNRDEFFSQKRSMELPDGTIGFRRGTPKVSKPRSMAWNKVIQLLRESNSDFLRTKLEVDKDKIIASRDNEQLMNPLKELGIQVIQEESFFVTIRESPVSSQILAMA